MVNAVSHYLKRNFFGVIIIFAQKIVVLIWCNAVGTGIGTGGYEQATKLVNEK